MVKRLTPGAARKQSSRDVYHMRRKFRFVSQRRAATTAKTPHRACSPVFVAGDDFLTVGYAKAFTPTADVGRVGGPMRYAAWVRVIVPSPARGEVDLQTNRPAE